jgi:hypothetical protein
MLQHEAIGAGGTAFLVDRCHVVSAFHVAFMGGRDPATGKVATTPPRVGHEATFLIGLDPARPGRFADRTRARVVAFGRFSADDFAGVAGDWAILRLDRCLGERYGSLPLAPPRDDAALPAGALTTIGFARSRAEQRGITVERGCRARDRGPVDVLVGVDCAFERGMSGGPILARQPDGRWVVVGLVQQSTGAEETLLPAYTMASRNQMLAVAAFRDALRAVQRSGARRTLPQP